MLLLIVLIFLAYSNSLNGVWAFDDVEINQPISLEKALELFGARKIAYLSFALNQAILPHEPIYFRLVNIFIHVLNSILIYFIVIFTLRNRQFNEKTGQYKTYIALISAAVFALHPLNINAVTYIVQRMASLSAFFVLLSLLMYMLANRATALIKKGIFYISAVIGFILAVLSKENGVMAVPLVILYDFVFLSPYDKQGFKKRLGAITLTGFIAVIVVSFFIPLHKVAIDVLKSFADISAPMVHKSWMATDVYWSPLEHILTEFRVICRYLLLFILPLPGNMVFDWWGYPVSKGLFSPMTTVLSFAFIISLTAFSIVFLRKYTFLSFGILWYLVSISLESFIAIGSDIYFEHRNYLPLAGLVFGLVAQIFLLLHDKKIFQRKYVFLAVFLVISLILGGLTYKRNFIWQNPVFFWGDVVNKVSYNLRANLALGNSYLYSGDIKNAEKYFSNVITVAINDRRYYFAEEAFYRLGFMRLYLESSEESIKVIEDFENLFPDSTKLLVLKGFYNYISGDYTAAIKYYRLVQKDKIFYPRNKMMILSLIGDAFREMGQYDEALNSYQKSLKINNIYVPANHGMAKLLISNRDFNNAEKYLLKALRYEPNNFHILADMANLVLIKSKDLKEARHYAERSISINPPSYQPYLIMATIKVAQDGEAAAEEYFSIAKKYNAPEYLILFNKAWAYSIKGDLNMQKFYLKEVLLQKESPEHIKNTASKILSHLSN